MDKPLELAKSITDEELDFISNADYGQDSARHKSALRQLIFEQNCVINDDQYWFPYEAVELAHWHCESGHEREFAICNVIMAISIMSGTDAINEAQDMLEKTASEYDKLPDKLRELVLSLLVEASEAC